MTRNPNQPLTPSQRQRRNNRRAALGLGGLAAVGLGGVLTAVALIGGTDKAPSDNGMPVDGTPAATASPSPSMIGTPETVPPIVTSSSASTTETASPTPSTSQSSQSSVVEGSQASCNAGDFTNDGVVKINGVNYDRLNFTITTTGLQSGHLALRQLTDGGASLGARYGQTVSGSPDSIYIPTDLAANTDLVVTEEFQGNAYACDGNSSVIGNEGGRNDWRPSIDAAYTGPAVVPLSN